MNFFLNSNRTAKHLSNQLEQITDEFPWKMNIVVREWNEILPEYEFRAFVHEKKLTAITHYYKFCYVADIDTRKPLYKKLMEQYYEQISDNLPDSCVIDFCINPESQVVKVVELNPWSINASASLFNWDLDRDVLEGNAPFEFRISEYPYGDIMDKVSGNIRILWTLSRPLRREEGEDLPPGEEREIYSFKWKDYKKLPFYKITRNTMLSKDVNWNYLLDNIVIVPGKDNIPRCFWPDTPRVFSALGINLKSLSSSEMSKTPDWISTMQVLLVLEIALIANKGTTPSEDIGKLMEHAKSAYQWLFDVFTVTKQKEVINNMNSNLVISAENTLKTLIEWGLLCQK